MFGSDVQDRMTVSVFYLFDGEKDIKKLFYITIKLIYFLKKLDIILFYIKCSNLHITNLDLKRNREMIDST
jgi:hypothetical protein